METKVCNRYLKGRCKRGNQCLFLHPPSSSVPFSSASFSSFSSLEKKGRGRGRERGERGKRGGKGGSERKREARERRISKKEVREGVVKGREEGEKEEEEEEEGIVEEEGEDREEGIGEEEREEEEGGEEERGEIDEEKEREVEERIKEAEEALRKLRILVQQEETLLQSSPSLLSQIMALSTPVISAQSQLRSSLHLSQEQKEIEREGERNLLLNSPLALWLSGPTDGFDEIMEQAGVLREPYSQIYPLFLEIWKKNSERIETFPKVSLKAFQRDNQMYHIPRMFSSQEHSLLVKGVHQRARAIQAFIQDHYFGQRSHLEKGIIEEKMFNEMISRSSEEILDDKLSNCDGKWGFWYGPDIIRGPDSRFYVVEDNIGYVGGIGDLYLAQQLIRSSFPEYRPALKEENADEFFGGVCDSYRRLREGERVVLLHYPRTMTADNEERRVIKIFQKHGVTPVCIPVAGERKKGKKNGPKSSITLEVKQNQVYLVTTKKVHTQKGEKREEKREKVGVVVVDAEVYDVDPKNPGVKKKCVLDEAMGWVEYYSEEIEEMEKKRGKERGKEKEKEKEKERGKGKRGGGGGGGKGKKKKKKVDKFEMVVRRRDKLLQLIEETERSDARLRDLMVFLRKINNKSIRDVLNQGVPGLLSAYFAGNVAVINGPGFDFLGDKLFCTYLDKLIHLYLKEEPILCSIPTVSFSSHPELIDPLFDEPEMQCRSVLKKVDGRGGDAVWVGPKIPREEYVSVREKILSEPERFIAQRYIPLSQVNGQLVDLRVLCSVTANSVQVSETLWGRGVPLDGSNGKVNISDKGFEFAICQSNP